MAEGEGVGAGEGGGEGFVAERVEAGAGGGGGDEELGVAVVGVEEGGEAGDFGGARVQVDAALVAQAGGFVDETGAGQGAGDGVAAVGGEGDGGGHVGDAGGADDGFVGDAPQAQARVQAAGEEEAVVFGVEGDAGDEVAVLECAEAGRAAGMPQLDRLVHGGG